MEKEKKVIEINLEEILPNRFQPRIKFNEQALNELAESIKEHGVLQPIIVRQIGDKYEIIVGERRYKASVLAGKTTIPAIVSDLNDKDSAEIALIENIQRENLTPIEEAISYKKILDMSYLTQEQLAQKLDKNQSTVANKLRLLNLEIETQEALLDGEISERHARSLLRLNDSEQQIQMLNRIIEERLTVRKTDDEIAKIIGDKENIDKKGDFMNNNIPTDPIIETEEINNQDTVNDDEIIEEINNNESFEEIKELEINEIPEIQEENIINPGFMDIDKIENEATDIYVEKPLANIDTLLKPDENLVKEDLIETKEDSSDEGDDANIFNFNPSLGNRFFNFGNAIEEENNEIQTKEPENNVLKEPASFEPKFDFNTMFSTETIKEENKNNETEEIIDIIDFEEPIESEPTNLSNEVTLTSPLIEEENNKIQTRELESTVLEEPIINNELSFRGVNLRNAISIIRNCSKELESKGYIVDVEELDFEDSYQAIFKINK